MHLHVDHPAPRHARPLFLLSTHDDSFNSCKCCSADMGALAWLGVRMGAGNVRNGPGGYE